MKAYDVEEPELADVEEPEALAPEAEALEPEPEVVAAAPEALDAIADAAAAGIVEAWAALDARAEEDTEAAVIRNHFD